MQQMSIDFDMCNNTQNNVYSKEHRDYFNPITGCKITMDGIMLLYEDNKEPYKAFFSSIAEAYRSFKYWVAEEEKEAKNIQKKK